MHWMHRCSVSPATLAQVWQSGTVHLADVVVGVVAVVAIEVAVDEALVAAVIEVGGDALAVCDVLMVRVVLVVPAGGQAMLHTPVTLSPGDSCRYR